VDLKDILGGLTTIYILFLMWHSISETLQTIFCFGIFTSYFSFEGYFESLGSWVKQGKCVWYILDCQT